MRKTLAIVHPDKTVHIEMPAEIFKIFCNLLSLKIIKVRFTDTQKGLRGAKLDGFILDEVVDKKLLTNKPTKSTIKSNQGSNHPEKGK